MNIQTDCVVDMVVQGFTRHQVDDLCLQCCHRHDFTDGFLKQFLELLRVLNVSPTEIEEAVGNKKWNETWRAIVEANGYPSIGGHWWPGGCDNNSSGALARALGKVLLKHYLRDHPEHANLLERHGAG